MNISDIEKILEEYKGRSDKITIGVLGGHSALDVCHGATKLGFDTVVVCQKGREKTYEKHYRRRENPYGEGEIGCVGNIILVDKFGDIVQDSVQEELRELNTVFVHNRYFWVYCDFEKIKNDFKVPIYGSRELVELEERDHPNNQYVLLQKAGIRTPKILREGASGMSKEDSDMLLQSYFQDGGGPIIVKVNEAERTYERAFFVAASLSSFDEISSRMLSDGKILEQDLDNAVIEEFVLGAQINFNYFYSPLTGELELMGTDTRRQTSLDGFLRLDAATQLQLTNQGYKPSMVETGHIACTMKESLVEKAYEVGEKFVETLGREVSPGIIGPFALQGAMASFDGREEFVVFDVSMRIPGSPGTKYTPYSGYNFGDSISYGERIAMELELARKSGQLMKVLT